MQSNQQCTTALDAMVWELDSADVKYLGRKMSRQAIVNGLILWLAGMPAKERRWILGEALRRIEDQVLKREGDPDEAVRLAELLTAYLSSRTSSGGIKFGGLSPSHFTPAAGQAGGPHAAREEEAGTPSDEPPPLPKSRFNKNVADLGSPRKKRARKAEAAGGRGDGLEGDQQAVGEDDRAPVRK